MLSWLFKKRGDAAAPVARARPAPAAAPPKPAAPARPAPPAEPAPDWAGRLQAALGDDAALLRFAREAAPLDSKLAAVAALRGEDALREAEREFRSHDRKVHRAAKQRLETAVAQREGRARADALLATAAALCADSQVPLNHVVALDRDWAALPAALLDEAQRTRFAALRAELDAAIRQHADDERRLQRWTAEAREALAAARRGAAEAAAQGGAADLDAPLQSLQSLAASRPEVPATADLAAALSQAITEVGQLRERLAWFDAPEPSPPWPELPPGPAGELGRLLEARHERWWQARQPVAPVAPPPAPKKAPRTPEAEAAAAERRQQFEALLQAAEAALAEGQLGAMQQQLQALDAAAEARGAAPLPERLQGRHQALRAEAARLRGWQAWGGGRAREDLVEEAEALARQTLAATTADADAAKPPGLDLKLHADTIRGQRQRWKELDRMAAPASAAMWQRFDTALQAAYQPVAAQQAALKATRQANLAAREALLATLDAQPLPDAAPAEGEAGVDWKDLRRVLTEFQLAWRKLGPVEHTVPAAAREGLQQRLQAALERLETPLQAAQRDAAARREDLIVQAEALAAEAGRRPAMPEAPRLLRDLQAHWQHQARQLPLPRALEGALWTRFKAATDAVFAQRDAAAAAREAEFAAQRAAREALIDRLAALGVDTPNAEITRTLGEVDRAWRQAGEGPRGEGEELERRFRAARAAAGALLGEAARRTWQAQCDALLARLALCEARDDGATADAGLDQRWAELPALPALWARALAERWAAGTANGPLAAVALDDLLLRLEAALDLPVAPERQAERRELKLRALKDALDSRSGPKPVASDPAQALCSCLRQAGLDAVQRARLQALVAALRDAPPGTLA